MEITSATISTSASTANGFAPVVPKSLDVINPATEVVTGRISLGSPADVDRAVQAARRAFPSYSAASREERLALL
jgi:aldehyde dehydrogenase (NAD+)